MRTDRAIDECRMTVSAPGGGQSYRGEIQNFAGGEGESDVADGETQLEVAGRLAGGEGECVSVVTSSGSTTSGTLSRDRPWGFVLLWRTGFWCAPPIVTPPAKAENEGATSINASAKIIIG